MRRACIRASVNSVGAVRADKLTHAYHKPRGGWQQREKTGILRAAATRENDKTASRRMFVKLIMGHNTSGDVDDPGTWYQ